MSDQDSTKQPIDPFNYISNELISYYNIVNGKDINHGKDIHSDIHGDTQSLLKSLKLLTKVLNEKPIDVK